MTEEERIWNEVWLLATEGISGLSPNSRKSILGRIKQISARQLKKFPQWCDPTLKLSKE